MNSKVGVRGFTLVELLISVALLSALVFTGSYVFSMLSRKWDSELGDFDKVTSMSRNKALLYHAIKGILPHAIKDSNGKPVFFFEGNQSSLLAVTTNGIFESEGLEIFRLTLVRNEDSSASLVYQAASETSALLTSSSQELTFEHQVTLLSNIQTLNLEYLGWESLDSRNNDANASVNWLESYSGLESQLIPQKLKLTVQYQNSVWRIFSDLNSESQIILSDLVGDEA